MNALMMLTALVAMTPFYAQAAPMNVTETVVMSCYEMNDTSTLTTSDVYRTTLDAFDALNETCKKVVRLINTYIIYLSIILLIKGMWATC